jgi:hypothetical protein
MKALFTVQPDARELSLWRQHCPALSFIASAILLASTAMSVAQVNSWTNRTSGNWEEMRWSLGVLPGPGQAVMITNEGWKAVAIAASTAQSQPQSLTVHSVTVSSPIDTFNTLLLNSPGLQVPLTARFMTIASNSALTMHLSALHLSGGPGEGMSVGGTVNHNDSARLTGSQFDVGWIGPGVYNLNSGSVEVNDAWVGGPYRGVFNQNAGTFRANHILHLEHAGRYNLRGGEFSAQIYTGDGTVFRHEGGVTRSNLTFFRGDYIFTGGMNLGGASVPVPGGFATDNGNARAVQSGGTNAGPLSVGGGGTGIYTLSNAVVTSPTINIGRWGTFHQVSGTVTTPATLVVAGGTFARGSVAHAFYTLASGSLSSPGLAVAWGSFSQEGGTNTVRGDVRVGPGTWYGVNSSYRLTGGLLTDANTTVLWSPTGGFFQQGGRHVITNELSITGDSPISPFLAWRGYVLGGGELVVSNIVVQPFGIFEHTGGTLTQSGTLTLIGGQLYAAGVQPFAPLRLLSSGGVTNSTLRVPTNASVVRFAPTQAMAWAPDATLTISNWNGSHLGGGADQIIFGSSASALTAQQVRQIFFRDPGGLSPGLHPTKILPTGEVVPDSLPPTGRPNPRLTLQAQPTGFRIIVAGETGANYGIERSFGLLFGSMNWEFWTNGIATNGTLTVTDPDTWPFSRFYRAVLMR